MDARDGALAMVLTERILGLFEVDNLRKIGQCELARSGQIILQINFIRDWFRETDESDKKDGKVTEEKKTEWVIVFMCLE